MGLCPDCRSEGEAITYVGGSKENVLDQENEKKQLERNDESTDDSSDSEDGPVCDLCGTEYVSEQE